MGLYAFTTVCLFSFIFVCSSVGVSDMEIPQGFSGRACFRRHFQACDCDPTKKIILCTRDNYMGYHLLFLKLFGLIQQYNHLIFFYPPSDFDDLHFLCDSQFSGLVSGLDEFFCSKLNACGVSCKAGFSSHDKKHHINLPTPFPPSSDLSSDDFPWDTFGQATGGILSSGVFVSLVYILFRLRRRRRRYRSYDLEQLEYQVSVFFLGAGDHVLFCVYSVTPAFFWGGGGPR